MSKDAHSCLGCGRFTVSKSQICTKCTPNRDSETAKRGVAGSYGPLEELSMEFSYNYSEDALGPHVSDTRWNWEWTDDIII